MTFGERIKEYIKYKGINVRTFEMKSTLNNGAIYRVIKNGSSLHGASIAAIAKHWQDLDLNWLMTGEGQMIKEGQLVEEPHLPYGKRTSRAEQIKLYQDSLERADHLIAHQKEMIDILKQIIERQKKRAEEEGIEL